LGEAIVQHRSGRGQLVIILVNHVELIQPAEEPMIRVCFEVAHPLQRTVVLPFWFVKLYAHPQAIGELSIADELHDPIQVTILAMHDTSRTDDHTAPLRSDHIPTIRALPLRSS
jgi:hypothetical protein